MNKIYLLYLLSFCTKLKTHGRVNQSQNIQNLNILLSCIYVISSSTSNGKFKTGYGKIFSPRVLEVSRFPRTSKQLPLPHDFTFQGEKTLKLRSSSIFRSREWREFCNMCTWNVRRVEWNIWPALCNMFMWLTSWSLIAWRGYQLWVFHKTRRSRSEG